MIIKAPKPQKVVAQRRKPALSIPKLEHLGDVALQLQNIRERIESGDVEDVVKKIVAITGGASLPNIFPLRQEVFTTPTPPGISYPAVNWLEDGGGFYEPYIVVGHAWVPALAPAAKSAMVPTLLEEDEEFEIPDNRQALFVDTIVFSAGSSIEFGSNSSLTQVVS